MFYELNTLDPYGTNPWKRSDKFAMDGTFAATLNELARLQLLADPDAKLATHNSSKSTQSTISLTEADHTLFNTTTLSASDSSMEVLSVLFDGYEKPSWHCVRYSMGLLLILRDT